MRLYRQIINALYFHFDMNSGYLWPVTYTRANRNGKCETLRMEIQLALYSSSKSILLYFSEVDASSICKTIVSLVSHCNSSSIELHSLYKQSILSVKYR